MLLIEDVENTLINDIEKNYPGKLESLEILENIIIDHISAIEQRKGVTFQVIAEIISLGDKKLNKQVYAVIQNYNGRIKEILADGIKRDIIRPDLDLEATATLFFGMTQGLVNIWALSQHGFSLQDKYHSVWKVFCESIIKR
jgi:hypothetical protein